MEPSIPVTAQADMRAKRLDSSLISRIAFDDGEGTLAISFRNARRYIYSGVPSALYEAFGKAASPGKFFNEYIKGRFACRPDPERRFRPE